MRVDCRKRLANFVMKFTADALSLFLLHMQDLNGLVLAANHALALLDEADRHGIGNAIRGRFVSIEDPAEQFKVSVIFLEERASQDVAKQENDAKHFMR